MSNFKFWDANGIYVRIDQQTLVKFIAFKNCVVPKNVRLQINELNTTDKFITGQWWLIDYLSISHHHQPINQFVKKRSLNSKPLLSKNYYSLKRFILWRNNINDWVRNSIKTLGRKICRGICHFKHRNIIVTS